MLITQSTWRVVRDKKTSLFIYALTQFLFHSICLAWRHCCSAVFVCTKIAVFTSEKNTIGSLMGYLDLYTAYHKTYLIPSWLTVYFLTELMFQSDAIFSSPLNTNSLVFIDACWNPKSIILPFDYSHTLAIIPTLSHGTWAWHFQNCHLPSVCIHSTKNHFWISWNGKSDCFIKYTP